MEKGKAMFLARRYSTHEAIRVEEIGDSGELIKFLECRDNYGYRYDLKPYIVERALKRISETEVGKKVSQKMVREREKQIKVKAQV